MSEIYSKYKTNINVIFATVIAAFAILIGATSMAQGVTFEKKKLRLASKTITVEVAKTEAQHQRGLMFRKNLPNDTGMIFIFDDQEQRSFWMKNTFVNLSIGFFDQNRKLLEVIEMKASESEMQMNIPTYHSSHPSQYALEMPEGWFKKNKIKIGDTFRFEK